MSKRKFLVRVATATPPAFFRLARVADLEAAVSPPAPVALERQVPPMLVKDEVIFLLHTTAEIEHSLMAQYLYAAFSLPGEATHQAWFDTLLQIATEEMGHLLAVQNMLLAMGAPLNFEREDYPFRDLYPFEFKLEPVSVGSLAKYVLAEMPSEEQIPASLGFKIEELRKDAGVANPVNRVGALFTTLEQLAARLASADIQADSIPLQADPDDWSAGPFQLVLEQVTAVSASSGGLMELIRAIGEQGEGPTEPQGGTPSHFLRFLSLYGEAKAHVAAHGEGSLSLGVPVNPTVTPSAAPGYLENPVARGWGDILNDRYRWLLAMLAHYLSTDKAAERTTLRRWSFEEMRFIRKISSLLVEMPQHTIAQLDEFGRVRVAGAPFGMPYSLALPARPVDRWRYQKLVADQNLEHLAQLNCTESLAATLRTNIQSRLPIIQQFIATS